MWVFGGRDARQKASQDNLPEAGVGTVGGDEFGDRYEGRGMPCGASHP